MNTNFESFNENKEGQPNRWFTVKQTKLNYWEKVISDKFARQILGTVMNNNGRCSTRQYNILKMAEQGNITSLNFHSKT